TTAAGQIRQSSSGLGAAADQLDAAGTTVADATTSLYGVSSDLSQMSASIQNAKKTAQAGLFSLQLAILAAGAALELLLGGTLCLALAYGPPRK
ncbi:MAG: hypothetical protein KGH63_03020, partial [Candidatus Micrarchaeota archaeon]|nr:hypothetical protein [Candidatus Micrarchaeota archaeon]